MFIHVVKPGELLSRIASSYHVTTSRIIDVNRLLNPNQLSPGQSLIIPTEDAFYTVRSGDTLWKIAQTHGTTVQAILQSNQIANPNNIYVGLTLYIPGPRYQIRPGESLWQIAQRFHVSLQTLIKVNNIQNPDLVRTGTILVIPTRQRPIIDVNAYIYQFGESGAASVRESSAHLTYLSPFAYLIKEDASLQTIDDVPLISTASNSNVVPMMSITNFTATSRGENLAHIILVSSTLQQTLFSNIINIMKNKGYRGVNIDFENVLPADRELYNSLLQRMVDRLHTEGYFVSTALAPKTSAQQVGSLYEAHDYEAHGRIADFVVLMTYEWGWRLGPPQSISPLNQIKRVLDYAISVIPREKIFFGFQLYARDWLLPHVQGRQAETFSMQEAMIRAVKYNAIIQYNSVAESPFFRYTDDQGRMHEVWFEDARSAQAKFDTVKQYNLRGISYWALGFPFPQNWTLLEDNFTIRKR